MIVINFNLLPPASATLLTGLRFHDPSPTVNYIIRPKLLVVREEFAKNPPKAKAKSPQALHSDVTLLNQQLAVSTSNKKKTKRNAGANNILDKNKRLG